MDVKVTVKDNGKNNIFVERIYKRVYSVFCFGISIAMDRKVNWGELDYSVAASVEGYQIWIRDDKDNQGPTICIDFNCKNFGYTEQVNKETIEFMFSSWKVTSELVFVK